ncbi:tRNA1(Val) (adenine(37)-N6)-methyltransferase [Desulfonatronovibrio magnus]|uniref:tRNA1(Val) (adenine(37)-N6)-methyltransferase n=1 Tax=Desulfonatronovibrio magnus TaxID=698827 RepID=UPI0005EBBB63|nr:methyltransferase domain-containing protein [Desulfonatronovibrio magnus]
MMKNPVNFPRGLIQPRQGYRFSVDSLLLSCFIPLRKNSIIADLGCGCGVIGFGVFLRNPEADLTFTGIDKSPDMLETAVSNSKIMGIEDRFDFRQADAANLAQAGFRPDTYDMILTNPPYYRTGSGRLSAHEGRNGASFSSQSTLNDFFKASNYLLKNRSKIGVVFLSDRMEELLCSMKNNRLEPKKILPVYGREDRPSRIILVEGVKNAGPGLTLLPPLILHNTDNSITAHALEFCPFLECNSQRKQIQ